MRLTLLYSATLILVMSLAGSAHAQYQHRERGLQQTQKQLGYDPQKDYSYPLPVKNKAKRPQRKTKYNKQVAYSSAPRKSRPKLLTRNTGYDLQKDYSYPLPVKNKPQRTQRKPNYNKQAAYSSAPRKLRSRHINYYTLDNPHEPSHKERLRQRVQKKVKTPYNQGDAIPSRIRSRLLTSFSVGRRTDNLNWNIASDLSGSATPNILSELKWKNVEIIEAKFKIEGTTPLKIARLDGGMYISAEASYGSVIDGDSQDSDYLGDNRTQEFSRSIASTTGDNVMGLKLGLGYQVDKALGKLQTDINGNELRNRTYYSITPLVGYSWDKQTFRNEDGIQTLSAFGFPAPLGPFGGLDSTYETYWHGPYVGLKLGLERNRHKIYLNNEYHFATTYEGEAVWNLRDDFRQDPSFIQLADGKPSLNFDAGYAFSLTDKIDLTIDASHRKRETEHGKDGTRLLSLDPNEVVVVRLNEVNDKSQSLHIGVKYNW